MKVMTDGKPPVITFFASLRQIDRYKIYANVNRKV